MAEDDRPTWDDVERAALHDVFLYRAVTLVRAGHASREEALIMAVLGLAAERTRLMDAELQRLRRQRAAGVSEEHP
jgi:hypothetical protein